MPDDPRATEEFSSVYSTSEIDALRAYEAAWKAAADAVPNDFPQLAQVQVLPAWIRMTTEARKAVAVFRQRGPMPEDEEVR